MSTDDEKALKDAAAGFYAALDALFIGDGHHTDLLPFLAA
jgi:hypothetical protein